MKVMLREIFQRCEWEVFLYRDVEGVGKYVRQPDGSELFIDANQGASIDIKPTFRLTHAAAQNLIEELRLAGVRPKDLSKTEGMYESQSRHLEDLRNILKTRKIMS